MRLKDKVALITGSSRGMGKATAILFAKEGAKIVVNYRENKEKAEEVVEQIKKNGGEAIAIQANVSRPDNVKRLFEEAVKKFKTIDILVNNAGIVKPKPFLEQTVNDWNETFKINVYGVFLCAQEAAKIMLRKKQGKIVNIASMRGLFEFGRPGIMDYNASKSAVISFTKNLAKELAPHINVNAVAPGFTGTEMSKSWDEQTRKSATEATYLKRLVEPEEIAYASLYLSSSESDAVTGEVLVVDAGFSLK